MKPKLLVIQLWGLGDLVIATPFIRAAVEKFEVTLLAKPYALELQPRLWPTIQIAPFDAPWTAFTHKYRLWRWPWQEMLQLRQRFAEQFEYGVSARWDPRDHLLLKFLGVKDRLGFPRVRSDVFLTRPLAKPDPLAHHFDYWQITGKALGLEIPERAKLPVRPPVRTGVILVHSGARLTARVWPLPHFREMMRRLRATGHPVQLACDGNQLAWWQQNGETDAACPRSVAELLGLVDRAQCFIGNCSGPGHLAAICSVPTFTLFGPSMHEWFLPLHPQAEWIEGHACPYKPCADYCRYPRAHCIEDLSVDAVWERVAIFANRHAGGENSLVPG
jgi:heptosyltransferase-2